MKEVPLPKTRNNKGRLKNITQIVTNHNVETCKKKKEQTIMAIIEAT
jgi:hypothetical protein